jgi:hypothetical protein
MACNIPASVGHQDRALRAVTSGRTGDRSQKSGVRRRGFRCRVPADRCFGLGAREGKSAGESQRFPAFSPPAYTAYCLLPPERLKRLLRWFIFLFRRRPRSPPGSATTFRAGGLLTELVVSCQWSVASCPLSAVAATLLVVPARPQGPPRSAVRWLQLTTDDGQRTPLISFHVRLECW